MNLFVAPFAADLLSFIDPWGPRALFFATARAQRAADPAFAVPRISSID